MNIENRLLQASVLMTDDLDLAATVTIRKFPKCRPPPLAEVGFWIHHC